MIFFFYCSTCTSSQDCSRLDLKKAGYHKLQLKANSKSLFACQTGSCFGFPRAGTGMPFKNCVCKGYSTQKGTPPVQETRLSDNGAMARAKRRSWERSSSARRRAVNARSEEKLRRWQSLVEARNQKKLIFFECVAKCSSHSLESSLLVV